MKISFVIPAYNEEHYIGPCLESILHEKKTTPCEIEIIVVDNGSHDRTREVAEHYPVILVHEAHKGLVQARRAGFLASDGDIVANVDADTRLTPGWIDSVAREFSRNRNLVALSGPFIYYDLSLSMRFVVAFYYRVAFIAYLFSRFILRAGSMLQGGNFVVRRDAIIAIGGFDTSITFYGEDTDLARRLSKVGQVKFTLSLPIYSSGRRLKGEGTLKTAWRYIINYLWVLITKRPYHNDYTDIRLMPEDTSPSNVLHESSEN